MGKTKRDAPIRAKSSESTATLFEFEQRFPDDSTCLEWLVATLYPNGRDGLLPCPTCGRETKHYRVKGRTCFECTACGHQEYPMRGTIFEGSSTSLRLWFYAIYLMSSTRCGISAKQLEREIGVTYPTAWRMFKQIRTLLGQDGDDLLSGTVEVDETFIGGKPRAGQVRTKQEARAWADRKAKVIGAAQRGGRVSAKIIPDTKAGTLVPFVQSRVLPASTVYTDERRTYRGLKQRGYQHSRINHSERVYVSGDVHTNTIEGFWALLKGGLQGVYHSVSAEHLQSYLDEFAFRYNSRENPMGMFDAFMSRIVKVSPVSPDPS
jgi:transposase-like protein